MKVSPILCVANIERSIAFYRDVLGFVVIAEIPGPDGKLAHAEVRSGDATVMLERLERLPPAAREHLGNGVTLYFNVGDADIDAYYEQVQSRGACIGHEIRDEIWGHRHFSVYDPDGYHLSFAKVMRAMSPEEIANAQPTA